MEITAEIIKKALKPTDAKQFITLRKKIAEDKVLTSYEQKKYDEYEAKIEAYQQKTANANNPYIMSTSAVYNFYGITEAALNQWKSKAGYPTECHVGYGLIDLKVLNDWAVKYFYGTSEIAIAKAKAALRREEAKAMRDELMAKELAGKLISKEEIRKDMITICLVARHHILSWVKRMPPVLKMKSEKEIMKILHEETRQLLATLAKGEDVVCERKKIAQKQ